MDTLQLVVLAGAGGYLAYEYVLKGRLAAWSAATPGTAAPAGGSSIDAALASLTNQLKGAQAGHPHNIAQLVTEWEQLRDLCEAEGLTAAVEQLDEIFKLLNTKAEKKVL